MVTQIVDTQKPVPKSWLNHGINLVYFGDFHHRPKPPATRVDDFKASQLNKVHQIRQIAQKYHAKALLQPGDFLDKPKFTESFLTEIMTAWGFPQLRTNRKQYDAGNLSKDDYLQKTLDYIPMVAIAGNHELYGGSIKRLPDTSLAFLAKTGFLTIVDRNHPYLIKDNDLTVAITGESYDVDLLSDKPDIKRFMPSQKFGDVDIFMVHEALYNTQFAPNMNWLPLETIWDKTKADVTIAGHIHAGFGWVNHHNKWIGNPGAIAQQSAALTELNRTICVSLIHINDDKSVEIRDIPLDLPKPKTIFDLSAKDAEEANLEKLSQVQQIIASVPKTTATDATGIINDVAKTNKVSRRAREFALKTYHKVTQEHDTTTPIDPNIDYNIKRITLHNFEAYQNTTIDLDLNKPTLLIGESSQGKSSVLRALYWVLENKGDSKQFIRRYSGVRTAEVTLERADGLTVTRFATLSKTGKRVVDNGYKIVTPNGKERTTNTEGVNEVQRLFGLNYLAINARDKLPINFLKQEDGWYFIGQSPASRAQIIGALYGTQFIAGAIKKLESAKRSKDAQKQLLTKQAKHTKESLQDYTNAEANYKLVQEIKNTYSDLQQAEQKLTLIRDTGNDWYKSKLALKRILPIVNLESSLKQLTISEKTLQTTLTKLNNIDHFITIYNKNVAILNKQARISHIPLADLLNTQQTIKQAALTLKEATRWQKQQLNAQQKISRFHQLDKIIDTTAETLQLNQLQELSSKLLQVNKLMQRIQQLNQQLADNLSQQAVNQQKLVSLENERTKLEAQSHISLGVLTVYGVKYMDNYDERLQTCTQKIEDLKEIFNKAKAEADVVSQQKAEAEAELRKLGIDPKNAVEEINKLKDAYDNNLDQFEEKLKKIEDQVNQTDK